jgi:hypothetical protein
MLNGKRVAGSSVTDEWLQATRLLTVELGLEPWLTSVLESRPP